MIYNDRVTIYTYEITYDELNTPVKKRIPLVIPCSRGTLTHNQQMGLFGTYDLDAFSLHLQGIYEDIDEISYQGDIRKVRSMRLHRNATVLFI